MRRERTVVLSLAVISVFAVVVGADEAEFVARRNEARNAILSEAGKAYYLGPFSKALAKGFDKRYRQLKNCRDVRDEVDTFDMLVRLTADGQVDAALAKPESRIAACYLKEARKDRFPQPPSAGFWVEVAIRFGKRQAVEVLPSPPSRPAQLLIASLSSEDASVRSAAAVELAGATELQAEALAALRPLVSDSDRKVRYGAAWAVQRLLFTTRTRDVEKPLQKPAKPIAQRRPQYPEAAFIAGIEGTVLVELLIGEAGEVARLEVRQSIPELDAAALACVRRWRFEPASVNGIPLPSGAVVPVSFRLY